MSKTLKVLIVDDETDLRTILKEIFEFQSWDAQTCANGLEALDIVKNETFDLIICDIRMPKCSGVDFLKQLPASFKASTPILMMSAYTDTDENEVLSLGARQILAKPIDCPLLFTTIDQLMSELETKVA